MDEESIMTEAKIKEKISSMSRDEQFRYLDQVLEHAKILMENMLKKIKENKHEK